MSGRISLRYLLVIPFLFQIFTAVGIVGYLSWRNGQEAVNDLANQLMGEISDRIDQHLDNYLTLPQQINQINSQGIEQGSLDPSNLGRLGRWLWGQIRAFPDLHYLNFADTQGRFVGIDRVDANQIHWDRVESSHLGVLYRYGLDSRGDPVRFIESYPYDPRREAWYKGTVQVGKPRWSSIYFWRGKEQDTLAISATHPVYSRKGQLLGTMGVELTLTNLGEFLQSLNLSRSGRMFILDREGLLIANSTTESLSGKSSRSQLPIGEGIRGGLSPKVASLPAWLKRNSPQRLSGVESKDPLVRRTSHQLNQQFDNLKEIIGDRQFSFVHDGKKIFVRVIPWRDRYGLDWLIVVAVPEDDFMGKINANTRTTILLCLIAVLVATGFSLFTSRWITRVILHLSEASRKLAGGQLNAAVTGQGVTEFEVLADSFNLMAGQLKESFKALEQTNSELERRVVERTAQLTEAETELRELFEAMTELVLVIDREGRYLKILNANQTLLYQPRETMLGKTLTEILPSAIANTFLEKIKEVLDTQEPQRFEYDLPLQGQNVWFGANISPISQDAVIWVARDISDRKLLEQQLRTSEGKMRAAFESMTDIILMLEVREGLLVNLEICPTNPNRLCASEIDPISQTVEILFNPETNQEWLAKIEQALTSGEIVEWDYSLNLEGREIWFAASVAEMTECSAIFVARDITDRKQVEQEVNLLLTISQAVSSASDFERALEVALQQVCEMTGWLYGEAWMLSTDGTALECSPSWYLKKQGLEAELVDQIEQFREYSAALTFLPNEELPGRVWDRRKADWVSNLEHQTDDIFLRLEKAAESGLKSAFGVPILAKSDPSLETLHSPFSSHHHPTSEEYPEAKTTFVLAILVFFMGEYRQEDKRLMGLVSGVANQLGAVLQQKQAEAELKALFAAMTDLIFLFDGNGRHLKIPVTKSMNLLYNPLEKRIGKTLHEVFDQETADKFLSYIRESLQSQQILNVEYSLDIEGITTWSYATISPISTDSVMWVARDITDRKEAEAALRVEQEKSERLLLNILPEAIAARLKQDQSAIAEHFEEVTILFADIVGFTPLSARLAPIELVELLNQIFSQFDKLAEQFDLEKIKTIGDAYMVAAGLPIPRHDHAEAVADMALAMQDSINNFRCQYQENIQIRIGINSGVVVAGVIGTKKFIYDLWGDAVNVASRMESSGEPGGIQVTEATYVRLGNKYRLRERGLVTIKGKGEMMTYWLEGKNRS